MSGDVHAGFCERREVRFLPATLLVALCHSRQEALEVKARLADWLAPRGLAFNEDKTRVVSLDEGLGRAGARCRRCRRSVSPTRPPNRTCPFLSIRLSTGRAMADRCH